MKIDLNMSELGVSIQAIEQVTIKGKDAPQIAKLLETLKGAFDKEYAKQPPPKEEG